MVTESGSEPICGIVHTSIYLRYSNPDDNLIMSLTAFPIDSPLEFEWIRVRPNLFTIKMMCYKYTTILCVSTLQEVHCIPYRILWYLQVASTVNDTELHVHVAKCH